MNERGKSDSPVVPAKPPNKVAHAAAEVVEERGLAKGNTDEQNAPRTQRRTRHVPDGLSPRIGTGAQAPNAGRV